MINTLSDLYDFGLDAYDEMPDSWKLAFRIYDLDIRVAMGDFESIFDSPSLKEPVKELLDDLDGIGDTVSRGILAKVIELYESVGRKRFELDDPYDFYFTVPGGDTYDDDMALIEVAYQKVATERSALLAGYLGIKK